MEKISPPNSTKTPPVILTIPPNPPPYHPTQMPTPPGSQKGRARATIPCPLAMLPTLLSLPKLQKPTDSLTCSYPILGTRTT
ncbi:hypothetical protein BT69DRAFT_1344550 [Atractiella rhizophila]|nr:hypothetical protein BT69DRAFT_1344550 [Atractiella rhizophila]